MEAFSSLIGSVIVLGFIIFVVTANLFRLVMWIKCFKVKRCQNRPLWEYMKENGITQYYLLKKVGIDNKTLANMKKDIHSFAVIRYLLLFVHFRGLCVCTVNAQTCLNCYARQIHQLT